MLQLKIERSASFVSESNDMAKVVKSLSNCACASIGHGGLMLVRRGCEEGVTEGILVGNVRGWWEGCVVG